MMFSSFPNRRGRRLRQNSGVRALVRETILNKSDLIWLISEIFNFFFSFNKNSSLIFFRSDIYTDYFFREIKQ